MSLILPSIGAFGYSPAGGGSAPTFQAAGTVDGGAGAVNTAWPAHQADDVGIFILAANPGDLPSPYSGWTSLISTGPTSDAGLAVWWKRATSSSEANAVDPGDIGNHHCAVIITFRGCVTGSTPIVMLNSNSAATTTSISITAGTTSGANRHVLGVVAAGHDVSGDDLAAGLTNATLTSTTNRVAQSIATGNGSGIYAASGTLASAGSTGAFTGTFTTTAEQQCAVFELIGA